MAGRGYSAEFFSMREPGSRTSAETILPIVLELTDPTSAVDVGCGSGVWTRVLESRIPDVVGVDGDWVPKETRPRSFVAHDLEQPLELGRTFDLAISMEVAEHLSPRVADRLWPIWCT
jgi:SAM-dependent methyltransferase